MELRYYPNTVDAEALGERAAAYMAEPAGTTCGQYAEDFSPPPAKA
ncbi:MAG: hypothetical protein ACLVJH_14335 [Faecalibacterium prausnitzii]